MNRTRRRSGWCRCAAAIVAVAGAVACASESSIELGTNRGDAVSRCQRALEHYFVADEEIHQDPGPPDSSRTTTLRVVPAEAEPTPSRPGAASVEDPRPSITVEITGDDGASSVRVRVVVHLSKPVGASDGKQSIEEQCRRIEHYLLDAIQAQPAEASGGAAN